MKKTVDGLSLFIEGNSKNRTIVFIHGFPFNHSAWQAQIEMFSADYYCIAYDIRGLGDSVVGDGQFTMESFVDDLSTIIDKMSLDKPILCAHSMGGYISLRALQRMQERFLAVILLDTVSGADNNEGKLKRAAAIKKINSEGLTPFVKDFITLCYGELYKREHLEDFQKRIDLSASYNPLGVKGCLLAMLSRNDTTQYLSSITIPSLLICGEEDALTPPSAMKEMSQEMKNSEFVLIKNSAHMSAIENPVDVNSAIKSFLEKV
ncbi:MAG: alpha/beta hydrolase [Sulfurimonas sp.]|uniref:alpha/beta fold hydrolase n=1 Tax=Sulfurimonas sp. TaxID=2022749 RepID=UPI0026179476|nr:alpha/beta hydrolase [Sulfurimonas sp.]MCW8894344.1 alpha/beta hydrolase [Sulfurimonas sp.]MCW8954247.1 alpha/beta hydrolase [Sulfurimonas sp.]MCW9066833.1 alpha/beta hydrolase [Sulfurimonas sp.]